MNSTSISGPRDDISDSALRRPSRCSRPEHFGSLPKLDADRTACRGLSFVRLGGRVYYPGSVLKRALAEAIAAGPRTYADAVAASRAPVRPAA